MSGLLIAVVSAASPRAGFSLSGVAMVIVAVATWTALGVRPGWRARAAAPFGPSLTDAGDHGTLNDADDLRTWTDADDPRTLDETGSGHGT